MEQFIDGLPVRILNWVGYLQTASLNAAVTLPQSHITACPEIPPGQSQQVTESQPISAQRRKPFTPLGTPALSVEWPLVPPSTNAPCAYLLRIQWPEVRQVVQVAGLPIPCPSPGWTYIIPVRSQRGTHHTLMDSGCSQTLVHQTQCQWKLNIRAKHVGLRLSLGGTCGMCAVLSSGAGSPDTAAGEEVFSGDPSWHP